MHLQQRCAGSTTCINQFKACYSVSWSFRSRLSGEQRLQSAAATIVPTAVPVVSCSSYQQAAVDTWNTASADLTANVASEGTSSSVVGQDADQHQQPEEHPLARNCIAAEDDSQAASETHQRRRVTTDPDAFNKPSQPNWSQVRSLAPPHRVAQASSVRRQGDEASVLIARQLEDLMRHPIPGIQVQPDENSAFIWHAQISGPEGSPYKGGTFRVDITFGHDFFGLKPTANFLTPIWHPNISFFEVVKAEMKDSEVLRITFSRHNARDYRARGICYELAPAGSGHVCMSFREGRHGQANSAACLLAGLQMLLANPSFSDGLHKVSVSSAGLVRLSDI